MLMYKQLIIVFTIFAFTYCSENNVENMTEKIIEEIIEPIDDSHLSDSLKNIISLDANRLAVREMGKNPERYSLQIEIEKVYLNKYYKALIDIYNSRENYKEIDSVFNIYSIRTFPYPRFNNILLSFSIPNKSFYRLIKNEVTENNELDILIKKYGFKSIWNLEIGNEGYVELATEEINNLEAVCLEFEKITEVNGCDPNYFAGDGSDIEGKIEGDTILIEYQLKWGDCPAGCTAYRYWKFQVNKSGQIKLVSVEGLKPPEKRIYKHN